MGDISELNLIKLNEGFKDSMYKCPADKWTIGYGINLEAVKMPEEVASLWLQIEVDKRKRELNKHSWYSELCDNRKAAITDMSYQLGLRGLSKFKKMIAALAAKDWNRAANEMLDSQYANQTPNRAMRNAEIIKKGAM